MLLSFFNFNYYIIFKNSVEETIEEKDYFVAQLYKFMDERGTPFNHDPVINEKHVDLFKLYKVFNYLI